MAESGEFTIFELMEIEVARPPYAEIGERLKRVKRLMGFRKDKEFCDHFGLQPSRVSNWFKGTSRPPQDMAQRICEEAGLTLDYIYRGNMDGLSIERIRELNKIAA